MLGEYDFIVIGSGFGGSVSTMRLAEKGYKVLCVEQGKRYNPEEYAKTNWDLRKYLWMPSLGMYGIQNLSFFKQASILTGTGVGGGSLVYANTLFYPGKKFFETGSWSGLKNWKDELKPFYKTAGLMMGRVKLNRFNYEDDLLFEVAKELNREDSFENVYVGVNLNKDKDGVDPYFNGKGPIRKSCADCAACMVGCRENAKNTLDKNYLYFAEKFGAEILEETKISRITHNSGKYFLEGHNIRNKRKKVRFITNKLIVSAGTLGTLDLLLRQKHKFKTLDKISDRLGENLLTNSETLCAVSSAKEKLNNGVAISSVFHPDDDTHIEIVKYPDGSNALKWFFSLSASGARNSFIRSIKLLGKTLIHPLRFLKIVFNRSWSTNLVIFLVMQDLKNAMSMKWIHTLFGGKMKIVNKGAYRVPAYIDIGQKVMELYAEKANGIAQNIILEVLFNRPTTAHILGGCLMGKNHNDSVVNEDLEVHNYPGFYIVDGSIIQTNPGVNPSYSILALAEYAMSKIEAKPGNKNDFNSILFEKELDNIL